MTSIRQKAEEAYTLSIAKENEERVRNEEQREERVRISSIEVRALVERLLHVRLTPDKLVCEKVETIEGKNNWAWTFEVEGIPLIARFTRDRTGEGDSFWTLHQRLSDDDFRGLGSSVRTLADLGALLKVPEGTHVID
jgi:hypothetical protein